VVARAGQPVPEPSPETACRDASTGTVLAFDLNEDLLARCTELAVVHCAVLAPLQDLATLRSFLDRCSRIAARVASCASG
jgi:hypothetical protein